LEEPRSDNDGQVEDKPSIIEECPSMGNKLEYDFNRKKDEEGIVCNFQYSAPICRGTDEIKSFQAHECSIGCNHKNDKPLKCVGFKCRFNSVQKRLISTMRGRNPAMIVW